MEILVCIILIIASLILGLLVGIKLGYNHGIDKTTDLLKDNYILTEKGKPSMYGGNLQRKS